MKPLALTYLFLLIGSIAVFVILYWSWQIWLGMGLVFIMGIILNIFLWDARLSGSSRKEELERWEEVKK